MKKKCENEQNLIKFTHFFKKNSNFGVFLIFPKNTFFAFTKNRKNSKNIFCSKKMKKESTSSATSGYKSINFQKGQQILVDGDRGEEMYVIAHGAVEVSKVINGERVTLNKFARGDFFGEMSLLEGVPRSADAFALEDTKLLSISAGGLLLKIRRDPTFALEMLQSLSAKLRLSTEKYSEEYAKGRTRDETLML